MTTTTDAERAFAFLELNERPHKPRNRGVTEIRGPYYTPVGRQPTPKRAISFSRRFGPETVFALTFAPNTQIAS